MTADHSAAPSSPSDPIGPGGGRDNGDAAVVGASTAPVSPGPGPVDWKALCKTHDVTQADLLRKAQEFARGRSLPVPGTLAEITDEQLQADVLDWLGEP